MPFTNGSPVEFTPDFTVDERLVNESTVHLIEFRHATASTYSTIIGQKRLGILPEYSFGWKTNFTGDSAARYIAKADKIEGLDTSSGGILVVSGQEGLDEYDWERDTSEDAEEVDVSELGVDTAMLIRLSTEQASLVWTSDIEPTAIDPVNKMWVMVSEGINTPWIQEVFEQTVEAQTKVVVARNLGALTSSLTTFLDLPFGECSLK